MLENSTWNSTRASQTIEKSLLFWKWFRCRNDPIFILKCRTFNVQTVFFFINLQMKFIPTLLCLSKSYESQSNTIQSILVAIIFVFISLNFFRFHKMLFSQIKLMTIFCISLSFSFNIHFQFCYRITNWRIWLNYSRVSLPIRILDIKYKRKSFNGKRI